MNSGTRNRSRQAFGRRFSCAQSTALCAVKRRMGSPFLLWPSSWRTAGREELHYLFAIDERRYWLYLGEKPLYSGSSPSVPQTVLFVRKRSSSLLRTGPGRSRPTLCRESAHSAGSSRRQSATREKRPIICMAGTATTGSAGAADRPTPFPTGKEPCAVRPAATSFIRRLHRP